MKWQVVGTKKGTSCRVLEGGSGAPVVFFHGAGGLLRDNSFLDQLAQLTAARQKILENLTWKQLIDERFIIAGSPETVRQQLEECIKGLHIGHLFCLFHNGNMPDWKTRHSSKLFAEKVMPHLRDMWPEWKHDERWWMHPMDDRIRPEERQPGAAKVGAEWPR